MKTRKLLTKGALNIFALVVFVCSVFPAEGQKCPRCWNWRELGEDGLCERCHDAV